MDSKMSDGAVMKKQAEKSAIKKKAVRFTKIVSLVGIRHATDERNSTVRRVVWVVWLLFGFGFAVFQINDRVDYYFQYPSKIEMKYITEKEIRFPQVTICNENEMMPDKQKYTNITNYIKQIEKTLQDMRNESYDEQTWNETRSELFRVVESFHEDTKDWFNLSKNLSLSLNDTIVRVSFDETERKDLVEEIVTDLGHCFAFGTHNIPLISKRAGAQYGLIVVLNAELRAFPYGSPLKPRYKILIHDQDEIPILKESGFSLNPGMITRAAISLRNVSLLGEPYDRCDNNAGSDYRLFSCQAQRDYESFKKRCNCSSIYMKDNGTICSFAQFFNCTRIYESLSDHNNNNNNNNSNNSSDYQESDATTTTTATTSFPPNETPCLLHCRSTIYKETITESAYPLIMNEMSKVSGDAQVLNRFRVHVFYPQMSYMQSTSSPAYTEVDLICDISGALSLLLGATLLTLYEAGEFFFLFLKDYLRFVIRK